MPSKPTPAPPQLQTRLKRPNLPQRKCLCGPDLFAIVPSSGMCSPTTASLTAEEKAKARGVRFGLPVPEENKKKARAERFGLPIAAVANGGQAKDSAANSDEAKKAARAAKFGTGTGNKGAAGVG